MPHLNGIESESSTRELTTPDFLDKGGQEIVDALSLDTTDHP